jgi:hypothetical protein
MLLTALTIEFAALGRDVSSESQCTWNKALVALFEVLSRYFMVGTEEKGDMYS